MDGKCRGTCANSKNAERSAVPPTVTVVTLSYNKFEYIFDAIDSVLGQDYEQIEYIIADDGSDQFPCESIEQYVKKRAGKNIINFQILSVKTNRGLVKNIANAYDHAQGEYLMPLSADDFFFDNQVISRVVERFELLGANILCGARLVIDSRKTPLYYLPHLGNRKRINALNTPEKQFYAFIQSKTYDMASGCVMYLRKSFYTEHGFDESFFLWEDGPYLTRYTRAGERIFFYYDVPSICYRLGGISTTDVSPKMQRDMECYDQKYHNGEPEYGRHINRRILWRSYQIRTQKNFSAGLLVKYPDISIERSVERIWDLFYTFIEHRGLQRRFFNDGTGRGI